MTPKTLEKNDSDKQIRLGNFQIILCFSLWGFLPLYFKLIKSIDVVEVLLYRICFSFLFMLLLILLQKQFGEFLLLLKDKKNILKLTVSSALMIANWGIFIFAVLTNRVIETSFGYFISPLFSIIFSRVFLSESLTKLQKVAIALVILAIAIKALNITAFPWISLLVAVSFSLYGLYKKKLHMPALPSFTLEMGIFTLPALLLLALNFSENMAFQQPALTQFYLLLIGVVSCIPLALFNSGVKKIKLSHTAFFQYITPSISFLTSIFIFKEVFSFYDFIAFSLIWISIILSTIKGKKGRNTLENTAKKYLDIPAV